MVNRVRRDCPVMGCGVKHLVKLSNHLAQVHELTPEQRKSFLQKARYQKIKFRLTYFKLDHPVNDPFDTMDSRLRHPFGAVVAGPTCCGKTQFVKRLLEAGEETIDGAPQNIIWCYGMHQPSYDEMSQSLPHIQFEEGLPANLESRLDPSIRNMVVIDDLMNKVSNDKRLTNIFTKGCHHKNLSCIFILQNMFHQGKELRNISLNCHYMVLFKSPRDSSQVTHLAKQMYPGNVKFMQEAFQDATSKPYGYLFCDLKPDTPDEFRLRHNIFPSETQYAYIPKI